MMNKSVYIFAVLVMSWLAFATGRTLCAQETPSKEYRIKAAFLYNFVMFVDSSRFQQPTRDEGEGEGEADPNKPILIGVLGRDPFGQSFEALKGRQVRNRPVVVRRFKGFEAFADADGRTPPRHPRQNTIEECHVLFICASEKPHLKNILDPIRQRPILTVADTPGFLETGGMINFLIEDKKVRFEINTVAAERAKLQIRAKLLRLAKRVVKNDSNSERDNKERETEDEET